MIEFQNICARKLSESRAVRDQGKMVIKCDETFETPDGSEARYRNSAFEIIKWTGWYQNRTRTSSSGI
jgi:hypothetical protein